MSGCSCGARGGSSGTVSGGSSGTAGGGSSSTVSGCWRWRPSLPSPSRMQCFSGRPDGVDVHPPVLLHQPHPIRPNHQQEHEGVEACLQLGILRRCALPMHIDGDAITSHERIWQMQSRVEQARARIPCHTAVQAACRQGVHRATKVNCRPWKWRGGVCAQDRTPAHLLPTILRQDDPQVCPLKAPLHAAEDGVMQHARVKVG